MALTTQIVHSCFVSRSSTLHPFRVLGTRQDLGTVRLLKKPVNGYVDLSLVLVELSCDPNVLGPTDCILLKENGNQRTIWGNANPASFPQLWGQWVSNPEVQASAINHILGTKPMALSLIVEALHFASARDAFENWIAVANICLEQKQIEWLYKVTLKGEPIPRFGRIKALPIRIAENMRSLARWIPPIPKPIYKKDQLVPLLTTEVQEAL